MTSTPVNTGGNGRCVYSHWGGLTSISIGPFSQCLPLLLPTLIHLMGHTTISHNGPKLRLLCYVFSLSLSMLFSPVSQGWGLVCPHCLCTNSKLLQLSSTVFSPFIWLSTLQSDLTDCLVWDCRFMRMCVHRCLGIIVLTQTLSRHHQGLCVL